jgi:hypothetical protein
MLYNPNSTPNIAISHQLTGDYLARSRLSAYRRAFHAADLVLGKASLVEPTAAQAAAVCGVSVAYVFAAKRIAYSLPHLRTDTEAGRRPLLTTAYGKPSMKDLLKVWNACSFEERCEFCREANPERVFEVIEVAIGVAA